MLLKKRTTEHLYEIRVQSNNKIHVTPHHPSHLPPCLALRGAPLKQLLLCYLEQLLCRAEQALPLLRLSAQRASFLSQGGNVFGRELLMMLDTGF